MFKELFQWLRSTPVEEGSEYIGDGLVEDCTPVEVTGDKPKEPLKVSATITEYNAKDLSTALTQGCNVACQYDFKRMPPPPSKSKAKVWIYNVSKMEHGAPDHPTLNNVKIPAVKDGEDYAVVTSIPRFIRNSRPDFDSQDIDIVFEDGRRVAMDFINPANLGLNQDQPSSYPWSSDGSRDLGAKGLFWSLTNPPGKMQIKLAKKRMEKRYTMLLEQARTVQSTDPKQLKSILTPEHHAAAEYFGGNYIWHGAYQEELKDLAKDFKAFLAMEAGPVAYKQYQ